MNILDFKILDLNNNITYRQEEIEIKWDAKAGKQKAYHNGNEISDCEILFFTGIKDTNGEKIYEGDLVKSFDDKADENEKNIINKVIFDPSDSFFLKESQRPMSDFLNHTIINKG